MTRPIPARYRLEPTDTYRTKRRALTNAQRRVVKWAEEEIAEDPDHVHWRRRTSRGTILDYYPADAGVMIEYEPPHSFLVALIDLIEL